MGTLILGVGKGYFRETFLAYSVSHIKHSLQLSSFKKFSKFYLMLAIRLKLKPEAQCYPI